MRRYDEMSADASQLATVFVFFVGVALCFWRIPQADRWHLALCGVAAALWGGLLLFEPRTRTPGYGFATVTFLICALSRRQDARKEL
jgi:Na+/H+ antiporter NhaD/arsenite permease-like protein